MPDPVNPSACFATLALGREFRFHAHRLALDLSAWAPERKLLVLTDAPEEFKGLQNVTARRHRQTSLLRPFHDKRFLIQAAAASYPACIVIDANTRILAPLPAVDDLPSGIGAFIVLPLQQQLDDEAKNGSSRLQTVTAKAAEILGVNISDASFIFEFMYSFKAEAAQLDRFLANWEWLAMYYDYHGLAWTEGCAIALAASRAGVPIHQHAILPATSFYKHRHQGVMVERKEEVPPALIHSHHELKLVHQYARFSIFPSRVSASLFKLRMAVRWVLRRRKWARKLRTQLPVRQ